MNNPFHLSGYTDPEYFCGRKEETQILTEAILNGRNLTIVSLRRMGKTGLISHVFHHLKETDIKSIYVDIYGTTSFQDLVSTLGRAVFKALVSKIGRSFENTIKLLKGSSIKVVINSDSGLPELDFSFSSPKEVEFSLEKIFHLIEESSQRIVIALDEFQQIDTYPEKNVEALLRTHIQRLSHASFIFSGSSKSLLTTMFTSKKRPFYQSTQMFYLEPIEQEKYRLFIQHFFKKAGRKISDEAIKKLFEITRIHTFYVQYLCNRLYASGLQTVEAVDVEAMLVKLIEEQEPVYFNYRSLLTAAQFNLLKAIAKERMVKKPLAIAFLSKHLLGSPSTVSSALKVLVDNDLLYRDERGVFLTDVFFSEWLGLKFKNF